MSLLDPPPPSRKPIPEHIVHGKVGTYTYYGCRCDRCKAANTRYAQEAKARRIAKAKIRDVQEAFNSGMTVGRGEVDRQRGRIPHGTNNGYTNYGCRCEGCMDAHNAYRLERYHANKELKGRGGVSRPDKLGWTYGPGKYADEGGGVKGNTTP